MYGILFTLPTTTASDIGEWSNPIFNDLIGIVALLGGILLAGYLGKLIFNLFRDDWRTEQNLHKSINKNIKYTKWWTKNHPE